MNFRVEMAVVLEDTQYGQFKKIGLQEDHIFLFKNNDKMWFDPDVLCWHCLLVKGENSKDGILVEAEGPLCSICPQLRQTAFEGCAVVV